MSEIKLQVGKTYRSREGKELKIVQYDGDPEYPYRGSDGEWYTESGNLWYRERPGDLVEEVTIPDTNQKYNKMKTLKPEVGKTYRSRAGEEVKIVRTHNSAWPYVGDNGESYNEQGRFYSVNWDSPYDLIEEVPSEPTRRRAGLTQRAGGSLTPFGESIKLLRDLADLQNGAPLEQYRKEWEETMKQVYDFLNRWEGRCP